MTHQLPDELREKLAEERLKATTRFKEDHNDGDLAIAQLYRNMIAIFSTHTAKAVENAELQAQLHVLSLLKAEADQTFTNVKQSIYVMHDEVWQKLKAAQLTGGHND